MRERRVVMRRRKLPRGRSLQATARTAGEGGEYEKVLKERKSVQIYAHRHGKQLQAARGSSPTSSLRL